MTGPYFVEKVGDIFFVSTATRTKDGYETKRYDAFDNESDAAYMRDRRNRTPGEFKQYPTPWPTRIPRT